MFVQISGLQFPVPGDDSVLLPPGTGSAPVTGEFYLLL